MISALNDSAVREKCWRMQAAKKRRCRGKPHNFLEMEELLQYVVEVWNDGFALYAHLAIRFQLK